MTNEMRKYIDLIEYAQKESAMKWESIDGWDCLSEKYRNRLMNNFESCDEMVKLISAGNADQLKIECTRFSINFELFAPQIEEMIFTHYLINNSKIEIYNVSSDKPDLLFSTKLLRGLVEYCMRMNVSKMTIDAEQDGSYAWLRLGFFPTDDWDSIRKIIHTTIINHANLPGGLKLSEEAMRYYLNLLTDDPKSIWNIVDARKYDHYDENGNRVQYSKQIMRGIPWRGELNFNDPDCMKRLNRFLR